MALCISGGSSAGRGGRKDYFDSNVTVATFTLFNIENEASMGIEIFERKVYWFSVICNSPVLEIISV